ncbi:MAG: hypothetical protein G8345_02415 [Magnetococcales bacterium]|nr:hypothetical protein [Magnetococcales bacterium]NGZ25724.1 hypothetical protein [Magnetococcales bacterium]
MNTPPSQRRLSLIIAPFTLLSWGISARLGVAGMLSILLWAMVEMVKG